MNSKILEKDYEALVRLSKAMKPQERLLAFLKHSRLLFKIHKAGKTFQGNPSVKRKPETLSQ